MATKECVPSPTTLLGCVFAPNQGDWSFLLKKSLKDDMPMDFRPWFSWFAVRERRILFGHWAALNAEVATKFVRALDGGCVWGGKLVALSAERWGGDIR